MQYRNIVTSIGPLLVAGDDAGLRFLLFGHGRREVQPQPGWEPDRGLLKDTVRQLGLYFEAKLREFEVPLAPQGTGFQRAVWEQLLQIPYGQTTSYGELARRLGNPKAMRAVGLANGSNPISIIIPCHRVIGRDGSLTGYGGGLPVKQALLALESGQGRFL